MDQPVRSAKTSDSLKTIKRQAVGLRDDSLVKVSFADELRRLPLVIEPRLAGLRLADWATSHRTLVNEYLDRHGAILFRGFEVRQMRDFEEAIRATTVASELLEYEYRSTPRTQVSGRIYTSTEYPAELSIPLHNEMSYSLQWPMKVYFHCVLPAQGGGETPIADSRRVYARVSPSVRARFAEKGVRYVRNYGHGPDLSWQNVFQTENKAEVEDYCRRERIEFEWKPGDRLRTSQLCQAIACHPHTGEMVWFNQAHLFHTSTLEEKVRELLSAEFVEQDLPRNAYYGDGSRIETSTLNEILEAYRHETVSFTWHKGDVLMVDNMLVAHGRRPYSGPRKILVGMAELFTSHTG
jgi:alpha-ketoglutarate-dependent taurine dioxygenase